MSVYKSVHGTGEGTPPHRTSAVYYTARSALVFYYQLNRCATCPTQQSRHFVQFYHSQIEVLFLAAFIYTSLQTDEFRGVCNPPPPNSNETCYHIYTLHSFLLYSNLKVTSSNHFSSVITLYDWGGGGGGFLSFPHVCFSTMVNSGQYMDTIWYAFKLYNWRLVMYTGKQKWVR